MSTITVQRPTVVSVESPASVVRVTEPLGVVRVNGSVARDVISVTERSIAHVAHQRSIVTVEGARTLLSVGYQGPPGPQGEPGPGGGLEQDALDAFWRARHAPHKTLAWNGDELIGVTSRDDPGDPPTFSTTLAYDSGRLTSVTLTRHADAATFERSLAYVDGRLATVTTT